MKFLDVTTADGVATIRLNRGKVNAINEALTDEFLACLGQISDDAAVKAVMLTAQGPFFSFGLDIPEFLGYSKDEFIRFVTKFAELYTAIFSFRKPVIAALNGHTVAGGCMLATACDYRIMVTGKPRISLNEIKFGSSLFPGSAVMLQYCVGHRNAELVAFTGALYSAEQAQEIGLVDLSVEPDNLGTATACVAQELMQRYGPAYESIKMLLRRDIVQEMKEKDERYRDEMVDIWYSPETWEKLKNIKIKA